MLTSAILLPAEPASIAGSVSPDTRRTDQGRNVRLRRRHDRVSINVRAVVYCGIASRTATICNISDGGLGLEGAGALCPGSEVTIALVSGETRNGVVRWWLAGRCGIEFLAALAPGDAFRDAAIKRSKPRAPNPAR